jgi:NADH:ubiquinone oxidoreductase subunit E
MSQEIRNIRICMGSSCFSRGNKKTVADLKDYLKDNKLEDQINLRGSHCMGQCIHGPVLEIDDQVIFHANGIDIESIIIITPEQDKE